MIVFDKSSFSRGNTLTVGVLAVVASAAFFLVPSVYAASGTSPTKTTPEIDGHFYQYSSQISNDGTDELTSGIYMKTEYAEVVPAEYMGGYEAIWNATTGQIIAENNPYYYPDASASIGLFMNASVPNNYDAYEGGGDVAFYNGDGYNWYATDWSPAINNNPSDLSVPNPTFPTNADGQTYGSNLGLTPAQSPDLIAVVDTAGQGGYVYANQLYGPIPTTPQQAVTVNAQSSAVPSIPVYQSNGSTILGQFILSAQPISTDP